MTKGPVTAVRRDSKVRELQLARRPSPGLQSLRWPLLLAALVLFCCNAIPADGPPIVAPTAPERLKSTSAETANANKPDTPMPKATVLSTEKSEREDASNTEANAALEPAFNSAVKPATTDSYETTREKEIWYGLVAVGHGAAGFDAWTTRRVVSGGYGVEADPLQRPFAHSGAIYATTQITPLVMDYVGRRMMRSRHALLRKTWWVPQTASASVSLGAGLHNYSVAP